MPLFGLMWMTLIYRVYPSHAGSVADVAIVESRPHPTAQCCAARPLQSDAWKSYPRVRLSSSLDGVALLFGGFEFDACAAVFVPVRPSCTSRGEYGDVVPWIELHSARAEVSDLG